MTPDVSSSEAHSLQFNHVSLERGSKTLFSGLSFTLNPGELIWLQGPNGSGKTSIIRIAAGMTRPSAGKVNWIYNEENQRPENLIGYQAHNGGHEPTFSAREELEFWADLYDQSHNIDNVLERTGAKVFESVPCAKLSAGQNRRLALSRLIMSNKPIWLMDEPKAGLDRKGQALVDAMVSEKIQAGGSVILATHNPIQTVGKNTRRLSLEAGS